MATCKPCSIGSVMVTTGGVVDRNQPRFPFTMTTWSIVSLAGCAENQGSVMKQGAEVTMNR